MCMAICCMREYGMRVDVNMRSGGYKSCGMNDPFLSCACSCELERVGCYVNDISERFWCKAL